jgi:hypothetical protein
MPLRQLTDRWSALLVLVGFARKLADDFPSQSELYRHLARGHRNRGLRLIASGRQQDAEKDVKQAQRILRKVATDCPNQPELRRVLKALAQLGFHLVRAYEHIARLRDNADGTRTARTIPNHPRIKGPTLRSICTQAGIARDDFLETLRLA